MPHKRAKASVRKANALAKGYDLPPSKSSTKLKKKTSTVGDHEMQDMPKNAYRILNSEKIRADFKLKMMAKEKDKAGASQLSQKPASKSRQATELRIEPGEKLSAFNRRVEDAMRTKVTAVLKTARNHSVAQTPKPTTNQETKAACKDTDEQPPSAIKFKSPRLTEFPPKPTKFSLHDIVMQPPLALTKPLKKNPSCTKSLPISHAQKRMLEEEREKVIKRYRQMKEEKLQARTSNS